MRFFLFKIFYKLAVWAFPCKERSTFIEKYCLDQINLHEKHLAMQKCIRPRTHVDLPYHPKASRVRVSYTDYWGDGN